MKKLVRIRWAKRVSICASDTKDGTPNLRRILLFISGVNDKREREG